MSGRILEARRPIVSSFDPDAATRPARPRQSERRWPVQQPTDALEAACFAGFQHFTRERDPDRAKARFAALSPKAREARQAEFLVSLAAYRAAGGR